MDTLKSPATMFFVAGLCGTGVTFVLMKLLAPLFARDASSQALAYVAAYLLTVPVQRELNCYFVFGWGPPQGWGGYAREVGSLLATYAFAAAVSFALQVGSKRAGLDDTAAFVLTTVVSGALNYVMVSALARKDAKKELPHQN